MRIFICVFLFAMTACVAQAQSPKYEVRAVWLTTIGGIDWPHAHQAGTQKRELISSLDRFKKAGINTVLVQTRVRASTIYPSEIEPFDLCLTGTHGHSPGYDPLQFIIDECHSRGMECHAWIVTIPVGKTNEARYKEFKRKNPSLAFSIGQDGFMNPENPKTGDYIARICAEVTRKYDIDGIHLDYIRYPETWPKPKKYVENGERRARITSIVRKIHNAVKSLKPWVKLSCSPIGKSDDLSRYRSGGWNAYNAVFQDAQGWLREGLMDQLYPMMYFRGNNFYPFAIDWQERSYGRTIVSGLGIYFLSPREGNWTLDDVSREMHFLRNNGIGHCYFRAKFLTDNTRGIYDFVCGFDEAPALIPPMTWAWNMPPTPPTLLDVKRGSTTDRLQWSGAKDLSNANYLLYNIYASTVPEVNIDDARNLIATRQQRSTLNIPHTNGQTLYYAVTAIDRYGNESEPIFTNQANQPVRPIMSMSPRDSRIPPFYYRWSKKQQKKYNKNPL